MSEFQTNYKVLRIVTSISSFSRQYTSHFVPEASEREILPFSPARPLPTLLTSITSTSLTPYLIHSPINRSIDQSTHHEVTGNQVYHRRPRTCRRAASVDGPLVLDTPFG
jgi:hypothetical protein